MIRIWGQKRATEYGAAPITLSIALVLGFWPPRSAIEEMARSDKASHVEKPICSCTLELADTHCQ